MLGRAFEAFWTQSTTKDSQFSDMPMTSPPAEETFYGCYKAKYTTEYLEEYVDQRRFAGQSLRERIRLSFQVDSIRKLNEKWSISGKDDANGAQIFHASKLIIASGLTSSPYIPDFRGRETFHGAVIHQESFGESSVLSSADIWHVTVLGGSKSAADMAYACAKAGKSVSWVVRSSGTGPGPFLPATGIGPYKTAADVWSTRFAGTLMPSFFNPDTWWNRFLCGTSFGRSFLGSIWATADKVCLAIFDDGKYATTSLERLKPHSP